MQSYNAVIVEEERSFPYLGLFSIDENFRSRWNAEDVQSELKTLFADNCLHLASGCFEGREAVALVGSKVLHVTKRYFRKRIEDERSRKKTIRSRSNIKCVN